jgi:hypothetical protein
MDNILAILAAAIVLMNLAAIGCCAFVCWYCCKQRPDERLLYREQDYAERLFDAAYRLGAANAKPLMQSGPRKPPDIDMVPDDEDALRPGEEKLAEV